MLKIFFLKKRKFKNQNPLSPKQDWPRTIPTTADGQIEVSTLFAYVEFFARLGYPPVIVLNYGTTFKVSTKEEKHQQKL